MGRLQIATGENPIEHLKRSFTEGDNHYEAQFWYARELFLRGQFADAAKLFNAINDNAPGRFRTRAAAIVERGAPVLYECRIVRKEEGYAFVQIAQFPRDIFAARNNSDVVEWDNLGRGTAARCAIGFTRRGPSAISVRSAS
jgi:hypothetical protein